MYIHVHVLIHVHVVYYFMIIIILMFLKVLSGKLMPANQISDADSAQVFRRHFLDAEGLKVVLNILHSSNFPPETNITVRQDCYAITLSLARFLLCGPPTQPQTEADMEDVDKPHPPVGRQMSRNVEDEVARLTIEVHKCTCICMIILTHRQCQKMISVRY